MHTRLLLSAILLLLVGACSSPNADDLVGTWDYPLEATDAQLVVDDFADAVNFADAVTVRLGFDGSTFWQGYVFDGELFLLGGAPEGDGGPYDVEGNQIIMTGADGDARTTYTWEVDADELSLSWIEQCDLSQQADDCTDDRSRVEVEDPFAFIVWEHTFVKSSDNPDY